MSRHFCGLPNFGNTCFLNTIVQCLIHNPWFKFKKSKTCALAKAFKAVQKSYTKQGQLDVEAFCKFVQVCSKELENIMDMADQNDIQEFFLVFVNKLIEQLGTSAQKHLDAANEEIEHVKHRNNKKIDTNTSVYETENTSENEKQKNKEDRFFAIINAKWYKDNLNSWCDLVPVFNGQLVNQIKCVACGYMVQNAELFMNIDVDVVAPELHDAFAQYFAVDHVDGWKCDKCGGVGGNHCIKITRLPRTLVITLKRFDPLTGRKKNDAVAIPKRFVIPGEAHVFHGDYEYQLYAIGCHQGNQHNGHYFAIVWNEERDIWITINDEHVMNSCNMAANEPYMLFYKAVHV